MRRHRNLNLLLLAALAALPPAAAVTEAAQVGGTTERVSVGPGGRQANGDSSGPSLSASGLTAAFSSSAGNLVPDDTNGRLDVFTHGTEAGRTRRVSVATGGAQADDDSGGAVASADGRYVAFTSGATNLVPGDTNGVTDVFVHERRTGRTERVSLGPGGRQGNGTSGDLLYTHVAISADGRYVAFDSSASNLVPGDTNAAVDVFVRDRRTGTTERVSVATGGAEGGDDSYGPAISADGRYVAFNTMARNLAPGDADFLPKVLVRDRARGTTERVSVAADGGAANDESGNAAISADGRYVAFLSYASNLVAGDTNFTGDVFVRDRQAGTTARVSVATGGGQGNDLSFLPALSADGRYVAFGSYAGNLVPGDTNGVADVFVRDRQAGTTERASMATGGGQGDGHSGVYGLALPADGRYVAFESVAGNLVPNDTKKRRDVFVRTR